MHWLLCFFKNLKHAIIISEIVMMILLLYAFVQRKTGCRMKKAKCRIQWVYSGKETTSCISASSCGSLFFAEE